MWGGETHIYPYSIGWESGKGAVPRREKKMNFSFEMGCFSAF